MELAFPQQPLLLLVVRACQHAGGLQQCMSRGPATDISSTNPDFEPTKFSSSK